MIPKIIYYAWFGNNKLSSEVLKNIETWKKFNPDYQIIQVNETRTDLFDYTQFDFTKEAYEAKKWAFVSDVARLKVVYDNGGIYLDTDVELLKPLDDILNNSEVWAKENSHTINSGLFFAAEKGSVNIKNILSIYSQLKFDLNNLKHISTVTIISKYLWNLGLSMDNKKISNINDTVIYPSRFFAPIHYWGGGQITKDTIGIHKYKASWVNNNLNILNKCKNILRWIFNELLLVSPYFAKYIAKRKYKN